MLTSYVIDWLALAGRWVHMITGIAWIGSSFYFVWLDNHLHKPAKAEDVERGVGGELWSVHGGGFYHAQKYRNAPPKLPATLHWFYWEAYSTLLSGLFLLGLLYYGQASIYLIDPQVAALSPAAAISIGIAFLVGGWLIYDALCRTPLAKKPLALAGIVAVLLSVAAWGLCQLFSGRGAFIHFGAMLGTIMVANVFFVIIPNQRKVVADLVAGRTPDPALGAAGKKRSLHNNYMTLPVLFIMMSHHYPMTYGAERPWLVLALLGLTGVAVRHVFNLRHRERPTGRAMAVAAVLAVASVTYVTLEKRAGAEPARHVTYAQVEPILATHCTTCHSIRPSHAEFPSPPLGVVLDSYAHVSAASARIKAVAVDTETMPLGNSSGMTSAEREELGAWIAAGKPR